LVSAGFLTGDQGLGHVVLMVDDLAPNVDFYQHALGFAISDTSEEQTPDGPARAVFLHCNRRHHTVALVRRPVRANPQQRLSHVMIQATTSTPLALPLIEPSTRPAGLPQPGVVIPTTACSFLLPHRGELRCRVRCWRTEIDEKVAGYATISSSAPGAIGRSCEASFDTVVINIVQTGVNVDEAGKWRSSQGSTWVWLAHPALPILARPVSAWHRLSVWPSTEVARSDFRVAADLSSSDDIPGFQWLPVIPDPGKVICVGLNYDSHRSETNNFKAAVAPTLSSASQIPRQHTTRQ